MPDLGDVGLAGCLNAGGAAAPELSVEKVIHDHTRGGGLIYSLLDHRLKKIDLIARSYLFNG